MFYENFLNSIEPNADIIPESASFTDMSVFTNRAIQDAYNEAVISMASNEMTVFEAAIHEADGDAGNAGNSTENKKRVLDYIKEFFAKIWSAIKGFFQNIITKIKEFFNNQKMKALNKLIAKFDKAVKHFKINKSDADFGTIKDPGEAEKVFTALNNDIVHGSKLASDILIELRHVKEEDGANAAQQIIDDKFSDRNIQQKILGQQSDNSGRDIMSVLIANVKEIKVNGNNIGTYADSIKKLLTDVNGWISNIKAAYNNTKKDVDKFMKMAKDLTNINHKAVRAYCNGAKRILSFLNKMVGFTNAAFKKMYQQALSTAKKVISAANKGGANLKESTDFDYDPFDENFDFVLEKDDEEVVADDVEDSEDIDFDIKAEKCK